MTTGRMNKESLSLMTKPSIAATTAVSLLAVLATLLLGAGTARAEFGIVPAGQPNGFEADVSDPRSGAHPDATTSFNFNVGPDGLEGELKDLVVDLPAGLAGNPQSVATCTQSEILNDSGTNPTCPAGSQIGVVDIRTVFGPFVVPFAKIPVFNLVPPDGTVADFGFVVAGVPIHVGASVRPGDYGLRTTIRNNPQFIPIAGVTLTIWGVPADSSHDTLRTPCLPSAGGTPSGEACPSNARRAPFLTNPTICDSRKTTTIRASSWQQPEEFVSETALTDSAPTECDRLAFDPTIEVTPDSTEPDAPSGYEVKLGVPQSDDPDGRGTAHLRDATVTMPPGVTISPSTADGLQACSDAQLGFGSDRPTSCPEASKIGSISIDTPVLPGPLVGDIHVGQPLPGNQYRLFLTARGFGVLLKLRGEVRPDPRTGQLTTTFRDNPQLPFSLLTLRFKGGPRAPLANPPTCGQKTVTTSLGPWSGSAPATPSGTFSIDCPGLSGFAPAFAAGTTSPVGGSFSPFALRIDRKDREQYINGLSLEMPTGLLAKLRDVPLCADAQAAAGTCGAESRVGTATVGAGPGSNPFFLRGSASLTGPYKGAPYGLSVSVRAIAGPYDLGTVVVRQAIFIDRTDAHLTVVSDPLPTILEGVPLRLRSVNVDIDRPGFMINPTSCAPKQIKATLGSTQGSSFETVSRLQVGDCQALPFEPDLDMRLFGRNRTRDGAHPGLRARVTQRNGESAIRGVSVKLPLSLALDPDNAQGLCEYEDGLAGNCPANSIVGRAKALTPLLNRPLSGPVYFVKGVRFGANGRRIRTLPTLYIPLRGEIALDLRARSQVSRGKLVTTFDNVPDAPISQFELSIDGGRNGILAVTGGRRANLCSGQQVAFADIDGQNGKRADQRVRMVTPCARKRKARLRAGKVSWRGRKLVVRGRMAGTASKRVRVAVRCAGGGRVSRLVRPKRGRIRTTVKLRGRCANARRGRVILRYSGGPRVKRATYSRKVRKRG